MTYYFFHLSHKLAFVAKLDKIDIDLRQRISQRMIQLRELSGKKQQEFAYEYGKDKQTQNKWEKGSRGASIYTINKFCIALGISLTEFFASDLFETPSIKRKKKTR